MNFVELHFPLVGSTVPTDHAYTLYSAVSGIMPAFHEQDNPCKIGPIPGKHLGKGLLQLDPRRSRLRLRLPVEDVPAALSLAGKTLMLGSYTIRLRVPQVMGFIPAPSLVARHVTIKTKERTTDPAAFLAAARRQLNELGIRGEAAIPLVREGPHAGKPARHVLRIKEKQVVGYSLQVTGLTAEESIKLQETGLGGRKKMGCGFFVPMVPR